MVVEEVLQINHNVTIKDNSYRKKKHYAYNKEEKNSSVKITIITLNDISYTKTICYILTFYQKKNNMLAKKKNINKEEQT